MKEITNIKEAELKTVKSIRQDPMNHVVRIDFYDQTFLILEAVQFEDEASISIKPENQLDDYEREHLS